MESSMEVPQKNKNRTTIQSSDVTPRHIAERITPGYDRASCTPMFSEALFKTGKL
jgi:hypothetical protein